MSTALYRRYRPDSFADVIGQEHVTEPLMAALRGDRVSHAYLFSGPRGCGKTTSARIFARCLNCAKGPTDTPCGTCDSCRELERGGPGSLDVVEMDAASHGGVDDARELRERAAFAPVRDRFKVFIIDEAHMVTTQGFNALLKLVEEPPEHVKFVFATTEPEKVIGTIRSRTHHYPFRLVPPDRLGSYLDTLAQAEQVQIASGVLPLVVRAGGGSVRDSLSVLDQLIAGADENGVSYERAVALLGYTHGSLLDDAVSALAARDGASVFRVVDRVISSGHAPRRFVEDLLERLRDLIVVLAAGAGAASVLRSVPEDQLERMRTQAQHLGAAACSRAADLTNLALTEMVGATSPQLQLELLCARLLLPAADDGTDGFGARLDRLETAVTSGGVSRPTPAAPAAAASVPAPQVSHTVPVPADPVPVEQPAARAELAGEDSVPPDSVRVDSSEPIAAGRAPQPARRSAADEPFEQQAQPEPAPEPEPQQAAPPSAVSATGEGGMTTEAVRQRWPEVIATLAGLKRITWALAQNAQVVDYAGNLLTIGFPTTGLVSTFKTGPHSDPVARAVAETLGLQVRIEVVVADGSAPAAPPVPTSASEPTRSSRAAQDWARPAPAERSANDRAAAQGASRERDTRPPSRPQRSGGGSVARPPWDDEPPPDPEPAEARGEIGERVTVAGQRAAAGSGQQTAPWDHEPSPEEPAQDEGPRDATSGEPSPHGLAVRAASEAGNAGAGAAPVKAAATGTQAAGAATSPGFTGPDEPDASDPDLEDSGLSGAPLIARILGGTVIDEYLDEEG